MSTGELLASGLSILGINTNIIPIRLREPENTWIIVTMCIVFLIYWIVLLIMYEKEKFEIREYVDEKYLFNKYNPLLAGCIVDSRHVLSRDIIAVILGLMDKGIIGYEIKKDLNAENNKEDYKFEIHRIRKKELEMDKIEAYIHRWLFEWVTKEDEKIDLSLRLKEMSREKESYKKLDKLDDLALSLLNEIGLNKNQVPSILKIYNIIIFVFGLFVSVMYIKTMLLINTNILAMIFVLAIICVLFLVIPLIAFLIQLMFQFLAYSRRIVNIYNERITGQRIVATSVSVILITFLTMFLTYMVTKNVYLMINELFIGIITLLVLTDNLMLKNDTILVNEYSNLIVLKNKLKEYTMLDEKDIQYIELWDKYIIYATAFGISLPIINKIKKLYSQDKAIDTFNNYDFLYYLSKSYLEVYWEFEFKKNKKSKDYKIKDIKDMGQGYYKERY